jgi:hypothetical protein
MVKVRKSSKRVKTLRKQLSKSRRVKRGGSKRRSMKGGKCLYISKALPDMAK